MTRPIRIANCSGFYGDRLAAAREMVEDGPIDVLTGDWLAELTMLLLLRDKGKDPSRGYAATFLRQLEDVLDTVLDRGIRVVSNAGGMNPQGLAAEIAKLAERKGRTLRVAVVTGDDVMGQLGDWQTRGLLDHMVTHEALGPQHGMPMAANAYLGAWGIANALERGADLVITGRTTDAAAVVGPAAWRHGWNRSDWDQLAGALVAGHVIECGCQATGGNYAFWKDVPNLHHPGFPIAEIAQDGSSVITKHEGTGGLVDVGTVTAQLLYEIAGPEYPSPDVIAHFGSLKLAPAGPDRVAITGVRGSPPSGLLKAGVLLATGWRNQVRLSLGGGDAPAKAELVASTFWQGVGGEDAFEHTRTDLQRGDHPDMPTHLQISRLVLSARDPDVRKLDKAFTAPAVEMALATVPGLTLDALPGKPRPCGVFWPCLVPADEVTEVLHLDGEQTVIPPAPTAPLAPPVMPAQPPPATVPTGKTTRIRLGQLAGTRSGDKAGNANVGFWVRRRGHWSWLRHLVTEQRVRDWLGGFEGEILVHPMPNLLAVNVELVGWLDRGVASNLAPDPQAKCLAECLRTLEVEVDEGLLLVE